MNIVTVSAATYTFASGDEQNTFRFTSPTGCIITIPLYATVSFPPGTTFECFDDTAAGGLTVGGPSAGTSGGTAGGVTCKSTNGFRSSARFAGISVVSLAANEWWVAGGTRV